MMIFCELPRLLGTFELVNMSGGPQKLGRPMPRRHTTIADVGKNIVHQLILGCPRKLGSMVSKWVISPTETNGVFLEVINPLILTFDPNFQHDIQVQPLPSMRCVSIPHPLNLYGPRLAESLSGGFRRFLRVGPNTPGCHLPPQKKRIKALS